MDNYSHKCPLICAGKSIKGKDIIEQIIWLNRVSEQIKVDIGSEFISKALDKWAYEHDVILNFSRPGKPTDNPFMESFNGSFRDECLDLHWFLSIEDVQQKIET